MTVQVTAATDVRLAKGTYYCRTPSYLPILTLCPAVPIRHWHAAWSHWVREFSESGCLLSLVRYACWPLRSPAKSRVLLARRQKTYSIPGNPDAITTHLQKFDISKLGSSLDRRIVSGVRRWRSLLSEFIAILVGRSWNCFMLIDNAWLPIHPSIRKEHLSTTNVSSIGVARCAAAHLHT